MVQSQLLAQFPELVHGFSDRSDGNLSKKPDLPDVVRAAAMTNRARFFNQLEIDIDNVVLSQQVHGTQIQRVASIHTGKAATNASALPSADGLITTKPSLFLTVFAADCLPIFAYEPNAKIVATAHAGWRGVGHGIIPQLVRAVKETGGDITDLWVWIGPHIHSCHYDLNPDSASTEEKLALFEDSEGAIIEKNGQQFLDLTTVAVRQLKEAGVQAAHLEASLDCTACLAKDRYFSYRQQGETGSGIMMGVIGRRV